jgi:hypothetical protein
MKLPLRVLLVLLLCFLAAPPPASAHVGNKDVFEQVTAGPYKLFVTIRMPTVIPGVANVEVRSNGATIRTIAITPLPITGEASKHPPSADAMTASTADPAFFTGNLWLMASGSWQVRLEVGGASGSQTVSIPVAAVAISTLTMQRGLGITLGLLGLFLVLSMAGIVAASVREARLEPGANVSPSRRRRVILATAGSLVFMALLLWGGARWWNVEAAGYSLDVYHPLTIDPFLSGNQLDLHIRAQNAGSQRHTRSNNDFLADHGHLMHLYAIRMPEMDAAFHLHPVLAGAGDFRVSLPAMPSGQYQLYGDVVHANGLPETLVAKIAIPTDMSGGSLGTDDASGHPQSLSSGYLGSSYKLPDGYTMLWDRPEAITANTAYGFRFHLLNAEGDPAIDVQPYMGMAGHAAFVKTDGTTFAHTHPEGSAAMPALMLANGGANPAAAITDEHMDMDDMKGMKMDMPMHGDPIPNSVEFPYGFPSAGRYRIFVQMKHGATIETGVFDATVQ